MIFSALITITFGANAQNRINGRVVDSSDKSALQGTAIFLPDFYKGTVTDSDGKFILDKIPNSAIKIVVSYLGYETQVLDIEKGADWGAMLTIELKPSSIKAQEVVVTGGVSSSQHDNAIKIETLGKSEILKSGTPGFMESLTMIPGVSMISKGAGVAKPTIRGLSMNDVLVLNDGVRVENYQFSENHPLGVDDVSLSKVEVIKGPASLLYGSDAIGGVVNFIRESPAPVGEIQGEYRSGFYSNTNGFVNSLNVKGSSEHLFGGIGVSQKSNADYKQGGGEIAPNTRFNQWSANANAGYNSLIGSFKLTYDYFSQKLGMCVPAVTTLITERGRDNDIWYQDLDHHLLSSKNKIMLGKFKWETNLAFQLAFRKLRTTIQDPTVEMRLNTFTYESKLSLPVGSGSEYLLALQGMSQTNRNKNNRISQFLPDAEVNTIGGMIMARRDLFSKMKVQAGIRYDLYFAKSDGMGDPGTSGYHTPFDKEYGTFNGSLGLTYDVNENILFRANIAKAYRVPNISELTSNGLHGSRYEYGNIDLKPENAYEGDFSVHYHSTSLFIDVSAFYNHIEDYIFISPTGNNTTEGVGIYRFSQTNARLFGGELFFEYRPMAVSWLSFNGGYSSVIGKQEDGLNLPFIPADKINGRLTVNFDDISVIRKPTLWAEVSGAFRQNRPSPYETETDGYALLNAGATIKFKSFYKEIDLTLQASNILDKKYFDHLSTLKSLGFYNSGRNISMTLIVPFGI